MREHGLLRNVYTTLPGDVLAADASTSATSITVEAGDDFDDDGGEFLITRASDGVSEVLAFSAKSDEAQDGTVVITCDALGYDYDAGDAVAVYPTDREWWAQVLLPDDEETAEALIPLALRGRIPLGERAPGSEEAVAIELIGLDWWICDMMGVDPVDDGSFTERATVQVADSHVASVFDDCFYRSGDVGYSGGVDGAFLHAVSGAGISPLSGVNSTRPGMLALKTGTDTAGAAALLSADVTCWPFAYSDFVGSHVFEVAFRLPNLSATGEKYKVHSGWGDQLDGGSAAAGSFMGWYYCHTDNGANWLAVADEFSAITFDTGVAADTDWHRFRIEIEDPRVRWYIDDVLMVDEAPGIPDFGGLLPASIVKHTGTTDRRLYLDYYRYTFRLDADLAR